VCDPAKPEGAVTSNAGEMLLLIDPEQTGSTQFTARVEQLLAEIVSAGTDRLPADRRYRNRSTAASQGIEVSPAIFELLKADAT
jgi:delta1-piperideine-2-carboxylate reductase